LVLQIVPCASEEKKRLAFCTLYTFETVWVWYAIQTLQRCISEHTNADGGYKKAMV
jgi:hypothetical protein